MRNCKSEVPIRNKKGLLWYKLNNLPFYAEINQIYPPLLLNYNSQDSRAVSGQLYDTAKMWLDSLQVRGRGL